MGKRLTLYQQKRRREDARRVLAEQRIDRDAAKKQALIALLGEKLYYCIYRPHRFGEDARYACEQKVAVRRDWISWFGNDDAAKALERHNAKH